jgi:hypothetical protein
VGRFQLLSQPTARCGRLQTTQDYLSNPTFSNFAEFRFGPQVAMLLRIAKEYSHSAAGQTMEGLKWT